MNFSRILLVLGAFGAAAKVSTFAGAGLVGGITWPSIKTNDNLFQTFGVTPNGDFESSVSNGDKITGVKTSKDTKGYNPVGVFATAAVTLDETFGPLSVGLGLDIGYRWNMSLPTNSTYGTTSDYTYTETVANGISTAVETRGFTVKHPDGNFFLVPKLLIGVDVMDIHVLLSVGLDISQSKYTLAYATKSDKGDSSGIIGQNLTVDASAWLFGIRLGLEAIFQVGPCAGVGAGVFFTYWPETMNAVKESGVAKKFNASLSDTDAVLNVGGTWGLTFSLTGHFAFG